MVLKGVDKFKALDKHVKCSHPLVCLPVTKGKDLRAGLGGTPVVKKSVWNLPALRL